MFKRIEHHVYPFRSPARYARKVGFTKSDSRGKQATSRSESQAFHSRIANSIAKSKNFERHLLTKITLILTDRINIISIALFVVVGIVYAFEKEFAVIDL